MTIPLPSFEEALDIVLHHAAGLPIPSATETLPLESSLGRVLAEPITADRDQPPFNRSTRDGYALRAANATQTLTIAGALRAGELWQGSPLQPGTAIEIMTGAPVPDGADAVVMVEHIEHHDNGTIRLTAGRTIAAGDNIVPQGAEARSGAALLPAGTPLLPPEIALAAACGYAGVMVYRRPRVAILATGDELVDVAELPSLQQIRNSNTYALAAAVTAAGGESLRLFPSADTHTALEASILQAAGYDLLLVTGGVSAGKYDLVEEVLSSLGATFGFTGAAIQPGKPVVFGQISSNEHQLPRNFFALPGNPVSTQVTFRLFVEPFLRALAGERPISGPRFVQATLASEIKGRPGGLTRFLPAYLRSDLVAPTVELTVWQGSGDLNANARANCYAVLPSEGKDLAVGEVITVLLR